MKEKIMLNAGPDVGKGARDPGPGHPLRVGLPPVPPSIKSQNQSCELPG